MENYGKTFFRAAMAGLGKYRMGGYGRIGVYRDNIQEPVTLLKMCIFSKLIQNKKPQGTFLFQHPRL